MQLFGGLGKGPKKPESAPLAGTDDAGGLIKDATLETFSDDVIQESMKVPVLLDFWAPWCGPCKQLTPLLEKAVKAAKGKVKLVKMNIDDNPELAQQLRVQSVPTVYAFVGGQPVTGFSGAQPESQIKALIEKLIGGPVPDDMEGTLEAAKAALEAGDLQSAAELFSAVMKEEPENAEAIGGLARCLVSSGQLDDAKNLLDNVPEDLAGHAAITGARAALELAHGAGDLGNPRDMMERLVTDEGDHEARYLLATSLFLRGQQSEAMEQLVTIVRKEREWNEEAARKQLVRFFDALGATHPLTLKGRRMLSSVLFS